MRLVRCGIALAVAAAVIGRPGDAQEKPAVKLQIVKYDGLTNAVKQNRGKVVLIDFWGEF
ncbi:MAG: hypothetical protein L0Y71_16880 [Gemmataceae bacterium]|nr:hypothetical protein [Gemmataceae bacterium]